MARPRAAAARRRPAARRRRPRARSRPRRCPRRSPPPTRALPFVGRADAPRRAARRRGTRRSRDDRRLVLLVGEPGIGKSRLAAEFTRAVHADGAVVLYGRFDETGPGAYQPVLEMLRGWSGGAALTGPAQRLGPRAADLAALLPELGAPAARRPCRRPASRRPGRIASACSTRSRRCSPSSPPGAPLLLVFDDLHWADSPTVQLLRHLVRAPQPRRTMFLGTYRDAELEEGHPLPELIASLRREDILTARRARRPRARRGRRADGGDGRRRAVLRPRLGAARGDRGQPVLRRGGHAPPARDARRARGRRRPRGGRACPRACARSPRGGSCGCRRRRARPSRWRR